MRVELGVRCAGVELRARVGWGRACRYVDECRVRMGFGMIVRVGFSCAGEVVRVRVGCRCGGFTTLVYPRRPVAIAVVKFTQ